ncbi:MAG: BatD family protein [Desulfobulbaceae bacterium]|nr:BatD family protein [Desulfobulbaceae bacterium]
MKTSRTAITLAITLLLTVLFSAAAHGAVVARVDRDRMGVDETLNLTITKEGSSLFSEPDLAPLDKEFRVLGQTRSSNTRIINGRMSSATQWNVVLAPKRAGRLQIPPLTVGSESTAPLLISVTAAPPPKTRAGDAALFVETEVDRREVFVQSQVLFTLRIFWAREAQIEDPGEPHLDDALVEKLTEATYDKVVDGTPCKVFERKFAIFPQKSGRLEIPPMAVRAILAETRRLDGFMDPFAITGQGREVRLRSKSEQVTVREKPPGYGSTLWLPTDQLTLKEEWSRDPRILQVGESVTLTIVATAAGLTGAQLPPIRLGEMEGIKLYQNQAEVENRKDGGGITGVRKETIALIPTRPGAMTLQEIRIPWWDKGKQQRQSAVLPARQLLVHGSAPPSAPVQPPSPSPSQPPAAAPGGDVPQGKLPIGWITACALLALGWLATSCLWWRSRRQRLAAATEGLRPESGARPGREEAAAFNALASACQRNDLPGARKAVVLWARAFWPQQEIRSAADLERLHPDPTLSALLGEMDSSLYGRLSHSDQWNGMRLLTLLREIRTTRKKTGEEDDSLPLLYQQGR